MANSVLHRIQILLKHINTIQSDCANCSLRDFKKSDLLVRATCFSVAQIGEQMTKLEKALKPKYSELPWHNAINMRTLIVHVYDKVKAEIIYNTIKKDLDGLKANFLAIANDLEHESLESKRLLLRTIRKTDAQAIFDNWASDPEVTKFLTWPTHKNVSITQSIVNDWVKEYKDNPKTFRFGITLKGTDELIGAIDVVGFKEDYPEIGYCLSRKHWNNGYMTEACQTFIKYLFDIGYKKLLIRANEDNIASIKVIGKCGFSFTHKETKPCSESKPELVTINCYELIKN